MSEKRSYKGKYAAVAGSLFAIGSLVLSPLVVPAFAARNEGDALSFSQSLLGTFTPAGVDSRLAAKFERQAVGNSIRFPFTPAGIQQGRNRTMTVAARTGSNLGANAVSTRNALASLEAGQGKSIGLHSSDYRLTASRGWQAFALPTTPKIAALAPVSELAGRGGFKLDDKDKAKKPSRFNTSMKLDQNKAVVPPVRGALASGDYSLDVGGSFSISRRIDVTAGVRYKSERDRVMPKADNRDDDEAVYVGTKIRF